MHHFLCVSLNIFSVVAIQWLALHPCSILKKEITFEARTQPFNQIRAARVGRVWIRGSEKQNSGRIGSLRSRMKRLRCMRQKVTYSKLAKQLLVHNLIQINWNSGITTTAKRTRTVARNAVVASTISVVIVILFLYHPPLHFLLSGLKTTYLRTTHQFMVGPTSVFRLHWKKSWSHKIRLSELMNAPRMGNN